jgi:hypothetical protein
MSAIDSLKQLLLDDRRFRKEAIERAQGLFTEIRRNLAGVVEALGTGEDTYPIKIDEENPHHLVALLGPRAVHIVLQPSVGVRKELVYEDGDTMRPLFQEIAVAPDHAHAAEHSVAIEFVRGNAEAFALQAPAEALIFATLHVGPTDCVLESKGVSGTFPLGEAPDWMPEVLATLIAQSLSWGISVWPGPRKIDYTEILEARLLGLPTSRVRLRERRIGFEPPRVGDDAVGGPAGPSKPPR